MKKKKNSLVIIVIVLSVLLVGILSFFVVNYTNGVRVERENSIYQQGAAYGYEVAVAELVSEISRSNCQPVPVNYYNTTVNLIDVACLQQ